ncbi:ABC transporter ATP-binding protein [Ochrovirga pacifica]|uniref:ABC transporter ATP-binding protein n=1 Tax=Ochrovirga pacifica TaxID=1042376 RepID=UPI0002558781|nr:ABC transporter ATP-binding protein [Ochrovirga pacifica]
MKKQILTTQNLAIGYQTSKQKTTLCKAIDLQIFSGEVLCLLGRNGAGKSTLLKTLAKLLLPLSGSLFVEQTSFSELSNIHFAKKISVVLTDRLPENSLTVYQTIALGRQPYTNWAGKLTPFDEKQINKAIHLTDIKNILDKNTSELSDGQLQRVMIARALAQDTPIILLDEPTSHLDIHHKLNIFRILKNISQETQKTILISTHEINLALKYADRLLLMHQQTLHLGTIKDQQTQQVLMNIFNSDLIRFDVATHQFIF